MVVPPRTVDEIKVGLIGHGLAGAAIHAPLIEAVQGFRIAVIATSRPEGIAARRHQPRTEADPFAVASAPDVDLVLIASPNETHFSLAHAALEAGKAVVLDKPFVLSAREADALIALAEAKGLVLTAFHNRRWDGDFIAVSKALEVKRLGEVLLAEFRWDRFRPDAPPAWRNSGEPGAGLLWDLGPHMLDQALLLFGAPQSFAADVELQRSGALADDYFEITLRYGRMRCILSASSVVAAPRARFAIHGSLGSFTTFGIDPFEHGLRAGKHPADADFVDSLSPLAGEYRYANGPTERVELAPGSWLGFYQDLGEALRGNKEPAVLPRQARDVIALIEQIHAQWRRQP